MSRGFTTADVSDQSGRCFIVTGANTGIGFEVASALAARRARVLLACRDEAKASAAMSLSSKETPRAELAFLPLDLADLASVRGADGGYCSALNSVSTAIPRTRCAF